MKKTIFLGLIAAALGFTACSSENDAVLGENTQKEGMVLNATVEQPAETRATIDGSASNWQFAFAENDGIKVTNSTVASDTYYTFTNDGTNFRSTDAETTATDANWFAYFPSNSIDLTGQAGTMESVANLYALAGTTSSATTGESGLTIPMSAKVAILKIENYKGDIDIQVKTSATNYVTGMTAESGVAGFTVQTSTTPTSLFTTTTTGSYYVAVPAGVQLSVKDGNTTIKSTGTNGLTAGKYYELAVCLTPDPGILTFTASESNSTIKIDLDGTLYKTSTQDWTDYSQNQTVTLSAGQFVQFKAASGSTRSKIYEKFVMTGSFAASGSVMSLLGEGQDMSQDAFRDLFNGCTSLTSAPELPATTLADFCYYSMFNGCTSLTSAPELPATTLAYYCYAYMFRNCSNLKSINVNFTTWSTSTATSNWVSGVPSGGTFTCPSGLPDEKGIGKIPTGWNVENK